MRKTMMIMTVSAIVSVMAAAGAEADKPAQAQAAAVPAVQAEKDIQKEVGDYFAAVFARLKEAADKNPTADTFRTVMKPVVDKTSGLYGATFIDTNFVIRQVYHSTHFLAKGFDLKKVKELDYFWGEMRKTPAPQVSEPGHGSIMQPRLIAMRYPVIKEGKLDSVLSIMVRTEAFLAATGLDKCKAYRITCRGTKAEEVGDLASGDVKSFEIKLPCNDWKVEYRK